jgi:hypothetical protein
MSGERVQAFVPAPLPPDAKTLDLPSLQGILRVLGVPGLNCASG